MRTGVNKAAAGAPASSYVIPGLTKHLMMIHPQLFWVCLIPMYQLQCGLFPTNGALCLLISACFVFPAGEYRLSRKDGAHYQGVPHPCQPLGSVLQPVSRTYRNLHTGRSDKGSVRRLLAIFGQEFS